MPTTSDPIPPNEPDLPIAGDRPRLRGRFVSLSVKLFVAVVIPIALGTVVLGIKGTLDARSSSSANNRASAVMLTETFAVFAAPAIRSGDSRDLQQDVAILARRTDIEGVAVWSASSEIPWVLLDRGPTSIRSLKVSTAQPEEKQDDRGVTITRPIQGSTGVLGMVSVRMSSAAESDAAKHDRWLILGGTAALGAALAACLLIVLRLLVVGRLRSLTDAAGSLARGESPHVAVRANDEVGVLADAFNSMVSVIKDRERKLGEVNGELREMSLTDPLTTLRNRRFFASAVEHDVHLLRRTHSQPPGAPDDRNRDMVVYLVDLDHFKNVNDTHGHAAGDAVLKDVALRLIRSVRQSDMVIRWGGEEFLIVARHSDRRDGTVVADRVLKNVGAQLFQLPSGEAIRVTCSVGWAPFPWRASGPGDLSLDQVVELADRALYYAKGHGRNLGIGLAPSARRSTDAAWFEKPIDALAGEELEIETTVGPVGLWDSPQPMGPDGA